MLRLLLAMVANASRILLVSSASNRGAAYAEANS